MAKLTEIEKFVKDHLVYVNRSAGEITYDFDGDQIEQGFAHDNPLLGIRAAIKQVKQWRKGDLE